jgi:hypothetical protein
MIQAALNDIWSIDFRSDSLTTERRLGVLNVIDDHNQEVLIRL